MECFKIVTHKGKGEWYKEYLVSLATVTESWSGYRTPGVRKKVSYELQCVERFGDSWADAVRTFASASERQDFIDRMFSRIRLRKTWLRLGIPCTFARHYRQAIGSYVTEVSFVQDYLQLGIEEHGFNLYLLPKVTVNGRSYECTDEEYRDALTSLIERRLVNIDEYFDAGLVFEFTRGAIVEMTLTPTPDEWRFPELGQYVNGNDHSKMLIWMVGGIPMIPECGKGVKQGASQRPFDSC